MKKKDTTILLVDDEPVILKSLARLLSYHHYEVYTANSGDEAIKALSLFDIAMVITDFRMPNMNGAELLEEIQKKDSNIQFFFLFLYNLMLVRTN